DVSADGAQRAVGVDVDGGLPEDGVLSIGVGIQVGHQVVIRGGHGFTATAAEATNLFCGATRSNMAGDGVIMAAAGKSGQAVPWSPTSAVLPTATVRRLCSLSVNTSGSR